jgi:PAS domain S-box-containing protein
VATSPDLITLTDMASGRYAMVNQAFERITGWSAHEAVGRTSLELGVWGNPAQREAFLATLRERGTVADMATDFVVRSGRRVRLLVSAAPFEMDRRQYLVINARDVTETERSRLEREAILANASIGIAVTRDRVFVLANRHFEQMFDWPEGALAGQPGRAVWPSDAAYREVGQAVGPRLARGETVESEHRMARRDGSTFLGRVRASPIDPARPEAGGTVWIVEDITERRQFEQTLARARDDAEAASRAKSAFLANTSHELRTPLNGMIGLARLARDPDTAEDERRRYLEQIAESAQSLAGIISDILDLSKIEAGKLHIETTAFDLGLLLRTLQQTYATLASARGLALHLEIAPEADGRVLGDELRVRQILTNFLSNALKFTEHGSITVRADRLHGAGVGAEAIVMFEVADTGPGIDPVTRKRLFRPFTQADQSTTRRYGGTGLGLSICSELAALMGGEVGVASEPGQGSRFWAELPLPRTDAPAPAAAPDGAATLDGARVLMVEDNPVNMMVAVATLQRWGVHVAQATDGHQAVQAVQAAMAAGMPFDAVLMDVQMPVMSGHEATRALRACAAGLTLPIIALTAAALVSERDEAMRAGMDDFLTKPINEPELRSTLLRWCTRLHG